MSDKLSDDQLVQFNHEGLIPGPGETEAIFYSRAQQCLRLKDILKKEELLPFEADSERPLEGLEEAEMISESLFDIRPRWVPIFFSNYRLALWHGGCAWIFQLQSNGPKLAFLQLRKAFANRKEYLKIYRRDELIAHELAHIGRMAFDENRFEEILAYRTSPSAFRRWLGPLVQSGAELFLFAILLLAIFSLDLYLLINENYVAYFEMIWIKAVPLVLVFYALGRLWLRQSLFKGCFVNLKKCLGDELIARHVIYRLTDNEIKKFSKGTVDIASYAKEQSSRSLRWRVLALAYFKRENCETSSRTS